MRLMERLPEVLEALEQGGAVVIGRTDSGMIEIRLYTGTIKVTFDEGDETLLHSAPSVLALTQSLLV